MFVWENHARYKSHNIFHFDYLDGNMFLLICIGQPTDSETSKTHFEMFLISKWSFPHSKPIKEISRTSIEVVLFWLYFLLFWKKNPQDFQ